MQHTMCGDRLKTQRQVTINCAVTANLLAAKSFLYLLESHSSNKKNDYIKKKNGECGFSWANPQVSLAVRNKLMFLRQIPLL